MSITSIVIGLILGLTLILGVIAGISELMQGGLNDFIVSGFNILVDLFGTTYTLLFVALFSLCGMIYLIRFVMSRMGENPGQSANK